MFGIFYKNGSFYGALKKVKAVISYWYITSEKKFSFVCIFRQVFVDIFLENYIIHASKERLLEWYWVKGGACFFHKDSFDQKTSQTFVLEFTLDFLFLIVRNGRERVKINAKKI